jgi:hypothetical protein
MESLNLANDSKKIQKNTLKSKRLIFYYSAHQVFGTPSPVGRGDPDALDQ